MIVRSARFIKSANLPSQYPEAILPEIAFAGRSNVGKSSLINTLINRKNLVKTSNTPGRTQLINFFEINNILTFIDIPGYGYAKVPVSVQKNWKPMIETYLSQRITLKAVVLILDIRRTPDEKDMYMINWLEHNEIPVIYVVTKSDKLKTSQQKRQMAIITKTTGIPRENMILFSAKTRIGTDIVWSSIERILNATAT